MTAVTDSLSASQSGVLPEAEDGYQSIVNAPLLLGTYPANEVAETAGVDSPDLLNEDTGRLA